MPFRVLSLDGGGAWALIEVRALMALYGEGATGHQVLKNFDLVDANSGGVTNTNDRSLTAAGEQIDRDAVSLKNLQYTEVRDTKRGSAAERNAYRGAEDLARQSLNG